MDSRIFTCSTPKSCARTLGVTMAGFAVVPVYFTLSFTKGLFLCKLKATGMLLRDIKRYAQLRYNGDGTIAERLELLLKHQVYVAEEVHKWQQYSENLQAKIAVYQEQLLQQRQNAGLK